METGLAGATGTPATRRGYQGETLQVFVFYRGQYLGYQCFGQEEVTAGAATHLDLCLPDCTPGDGAWGFRVSNGRVQAWFRTPARETGNEAGEAPREVEPLEGFSIGAYRLQVKLLLPQSFSRHCQAFAAPGDQSPKTSENPGGGPAAALPAGVPAAGAGPTAASATASSPAGEAGLQPGMPAESPTRTPAGEGPFPVGETSAPNEAVAPEEGSLRLEAEADDEDEEGNVTEYFSLLREVLPSRRESDSPPSASRRAVEVVCFRRGDVREVACLEQPGFYAIRSDWNRRTCREQGGPLPGFKMVRYRKGGTAELHIRPGIRGRLFSGEGSRDVRDSGRETTRGRGKAAESFRVPLAADAWALLRVEPYRYLVRYVPLKPRPPVPALRPLLSRGQFKLVSVSVVCHLLLLLSIGLVVPRAVLEGKARDDRFARLDPTMLDTLKPKPPEPSPQVREIKAPPVIKPLPVTRRELLKPAAQTRETAPSSPEAGADRVEQGAPQEGALSTGGGTGEVDVSTTGLLAALDNSASGQGGGVAVSGAGNSQVLLAALTNLDGVAVPAGSTTFNLAGVAGKLRSSEIQIARGGGGGVIQTHGTREIMKGSGNSIGALASKGSGQVKATVKEPPKASISIQGGMSREAVLKVVTEHLDDVRDCYERELLHNPGLSGKILLEWLIQGDGSVRYAKVKFNNIGNSTDLSVCVPSLVKTWVFPRPSGSGEVVVTFPFVFECFGF